MTDKPPSSPRRGRRAGRPDTRGGILEAAQKLFSSHGFDGTSMRAIAREAEVDPALVHHYFQDKTELLLASARLALDPRKVIRGAVAGDRATLGLRLVGTVLTVWESPFGSTLVHVARRHPALFHGFTGVISTEVIEVVIHQLGFSHQEGMERLAMVETIMGGIFMTRYVARMEPMASLQRRDVIRLFGPLVQQVIDCGATPV